MDNTAQITVVITRYAESINLIKDCLDSLVRQTNIFCHVLFLDQKVCPQTKAYVDQLKSKNAIFQYIQTPPKSLSYSRNLGIKLSKTNLVAFCDVDCILPLNWLSEILSTFKNTESAIVGTKVVPKWQGTTKWYHHSRLIQEFYSLIDLSNQVCSIPKVVGASFALNKNLLKKTGYFNENLGRKNGNFLGGEETDLCQRVTNQGLKIYYTPHTFAYHQVPPNRMSFSWIQKRAFSGGVSRALRGGKSEPFNQTSTIYDRLALILILPAYALGFLKGKTS